MDIKDATDTASARTISNDDDEEYDIANDPYIETPWSILYAYFRGSQIGRFVRHQIESYNHFIGFQISKTIEMFNPLHIASKDDYDPVSGKHSLEIFITFENFHIYRPQIHENNGSIKLMFPQEARLRNFTYEAATTIDLHIQYIVRTGPNLENTTTLHKTIPRVHIGKLPIMLRSSVCVLTQYRHFDAQHTGECKFDAGGYFIVDGSEKIALSQERGAENRINCHYVEKSDKKHLWKAEIKSVPDYKCISPKQISMYVSSADNGFGHAITVEVPRMKKAIPLFVLFRALGVVSDKSICERIVLCLDPGRVDVNTQMMLEALRASMYDASRYTSHETALAYVTSLSIFTPLNMDRETGLRKKHEFTVDVLNNDLFPHCRGLEQKLYFLGYMAYRLLLSYLELRKADDRDSYLNKRIDLTGSLLNNLYRNYFNKLVKDMTKQVVHEINGGSWKASDDYENIINLTNIYNIVKSTTLEHGIRRALSTGDFGIKNTNSNKVGVAQVYNRLNYVSSLSHARRVSTPTEKSGKLIPPRRLHSTSWGYLCVTGDTEVLLANRTDCRPIQFLRNGDAVTTVHRTTLQEEPSLMHRFFGRMPHTTLYEITTASGRRIKATADHPLLVCCVGEASYGMKPVGDLRVGDAMVIRHTARHIPDTDETSVAIRDCDVAERYRAELMQKGMLNDHLSVARLRIIARLVGYIHSRLHTWPSQGVGVGMGGFVQRNDTTQRNDIVTGTATAPSSRVGGKEPTREHREPNSYHCQFYTETDEDTFQITNDIQALGFTEFQVTLRSAEAPYDVISSSGTVFAYFMYLLAGVTVPFTTNTKVPEWLMHSEPSIQREFLAAFQGVRLAQEHSHCVIRDMEWVTQDRTITAAKEYATNIAKMFLNVGIRSNARLAIEHTERLHYYSTKLSLRNDKRNVMLYCDHMQCTYRDSLRRASAILIEQTKVSAHKTSTAVVVPLSSGCVGVPIVEIREIPPELVYDFTTVSDNHSFVASSFVSSNCPAETPEGPSVGIVKNLSYMTHVTIHSNATPLYEYILPLVHCVDDAHILPSDLYQQTKVFINGAWVGVTEDPLGLYRSLKTKKSEGIINVYTSVVFDYVANEIRVCNDSGRLTRPLFRVNDKRNLWLSRTLLSQVEAGTVSWDQLMMSTRTRDAVVEYIDPEETDCGAMIATAPSDLIEPTNRLKKYTHCEIHPSTIFGVLASCIPFPEHNQSPRNCYQCAQGKQAMGVYATNYENRMDKTAYILNYPMKPLVETRIMNLIQLNQIPSGTQAVVAIMTHSGYNQEDSLLINQGSIDRGMALATIYHTEKDEDKQRTNGDEEIRCKPDKTKTRGVKMANYNKVNARGLVPEDTLIENRDVIIAKVTPIKEHRHDHTKVVKFEDHSRIYDTTEETFLDRNYLDKNGGGYTFAKVRLRALRKPVIGDKFSSRHGQKGTVGNIIPECDMPFTATGLKPDIIINPHAIPSRMTIGQLKETLLGKLLVALGLFGDGTAFSKLDVATIRNGLLRAGFEANGDELMYNGQTGEQINYSVFTGPVFYQRLKHMVEDKAHSRSIGPMVNLTRQPAEGRSRKGGMRLGEMEKDCMVSHGASRFTRERIYDVSDKYSVHVCNRCGGIAAFNEVVRIHNCKRCENRTDFSYVEIPYAFKLMHQELQAMNVTMRLITDDGAMC